MKNLAKPLEWNKPWNDKSQHAYAYNFGTMYLAYEYVKGSAEFAATSSIDDSVIWKRTGFKSIEEAKAACQQHYAESLLGNLSPEARAIFEKHLNPQTPTV